MRTTVTLNDELENRLRSYANEHSLKFKQALNDILSIGLEQIQRRKAPNPYQTEPKRVGLKNGLNYDNVAELLEQVEGPDYR